MSAQQLSDACAELGGDLPRTVISNIENGRRGNVSVADTALLAAALGVPPAALVYPVGYEDEVEYLPGRTVSPLQAVDWWHGEPAPDGGALALLRRHQQLETMIRRLYRSLWEQSISDYRWHGEPGGPEAEAARQAAEDMTRDLHELRDEITRRGLVPPPLSGLDRPA